MLLCKPSVAMSNLFYNLSCQNLPNGLLTQSPSKPKIEKSCTMYIWHMHMFVYIWSRPPVQIASSFFGFCQICGCYVWFHDLTRYQGFSGASSLGNNTGSYPNFRVSVSLTASKTRSSSFILTPSSKARQIRMQPADGSETRDTAAGVTRSNWVWNQ